MSADTTAPKPTPSTDAKTQVTTMEELNADAKQSTAGRTRRRALTIVAAVVILGALAALAWYFLIGEYSESTDDAYVQGDVAQISAQLPGTIVAVNVRDGDLVHAGDTLVQLDKADADVALVEAKSALANAVRQSHGLYSQANSASSELTLRRQSFNTAKNDYERRAALAKTGAVSAEELDHARQAYEAAQSAFSVAQQQFDQRNVLVQGTTLSNQPAVEIAAAKLRVAYLNAQRNAIVSPLTGYVAKRSAQVGQRIQPGQALMAVVPLSDVWVDANFKETQLRKMRLGQPATIEADVYGSKVKYTGKVASLGVGTGSAFALLPAQNATGNWIKIVQRVPVRIQLDDPKQLQSHPLRLGMSTSVDVDVHKQDGPMLATQPTGKTAQSTDVYIKQSQQADALIQTIIQSNLPSGRLSKG